MLFFTLAAFQASAVDPSRTIFQYNCQTWRRQNGLPATAVNAITQTRDGYLWLGTAAGLVRFDGNEFKLIDLGHGSLLRTSIISCLSSSRQSRLWLGLERSSFGSWDGRDFSFCGKDEWGGASQNVHSLIETADGAICITGENQSGRLTTNNTYEIFTGLDGFDVTSICEGANGRIWLGTSRHGLFYWQNGVVAKFPDNVLDDRIIRSLAEDKQGSIWVGTETGLFCYDAQFQKKPLPYPWYETRALLVDHNGAVWVGTTGGGVVRYLNDTPQQFRQTDGLADDFVNALAEDTEGSLWVGTRNGLSQFSDVKIPTYGKNEGLVADVDIAVSPAKNGGLWVATGQGFTYFNRSSNVISNYSTNVGLTNLYIKDVLEASNGDIYVANGERDVEVLSGGRVVATYTNAVWPTAFAEDAKGVIVAAGGLYRVGVNYYTPYVFTGAQPPSLSWVFNMITAHDGSVWLASSEGIVRLQDGAFQIWTKDGGLSDSKAICISEDDDHTIWAGLETGIVRIKNGQVKNITRENGLFDNVIYSIVPDNQGSLWIASGSGLFRVSRKILNDFAEDRTNHVTCVAYDSLDEVKSFERNQQEFSGCKTLDGKIWFPTAQGVVMVDSTNITTNLVSPKIQIQSVRANGRELVGAGETTVRPGKGELEIHYAGLSYIAPQKIRYRYKLDGYDTNWVEADARRSAFYTNLRPGKYHFHVLACNEDGVWDATGASFAVELLPYFYQTAWFYVLMGALVLVALSGVYAWRMRHLRRKQRKLQEAHDLLETKVRERTGELAKTNSSLKGEIEERKRIEAEIQRIHRQLLDASRMAGQAEVASSVLHNVGNVLNSVNVSTALIRERLRKMRLASLAKAAQMMQDHADDLGSFLTTDAKGIHLPKYLEELSHHLGDEQNDLLTELVSLSRNVEHINEIVAMQQNYAKVLGVVEKVAPSDLVESAFKVQITAYERHSVKLVRDYQDVPVISADRHKVLQILINIFSNAKYACDQNQSPDKRVVVSIKTCGRDSVLIEISDNGVGIAPENLTSIFSHGFTTKKDGHGFGLHSAALAAKEMGGTLTAHSEGVGKGATFSLELPCNPSSMKESQIMPSFAETGSQ